MPAWWGWSLVNMREGTEDARCDPQPVPESHRSCEWMRCRWWGLSLEEGICSSVRASLQRTGGNPHPLQRSPPLQGEECHWVIMPGAWSTWCLRKKTHSGKPALHVMTTHKASSMWAGWSDFHQQIPAARHGSVQQQCCETRHGLCYRHYKLIHLFVARDHEWIHVMYLGYSLTCTWPWVSTHDITSDISLSFLAHDREYIVLYFDMITGLVMIG